MALFRQIIMPSGNHCDRLRASTMIMGKKEQELREGKEQRDRGMSLSFCLPIRFPELVKVSDSIH